MSGKGNNRHIKRLAANEYPKVGRKTAVYMAKPRAGRHNLQGSIALLFIIRDKLGLASTGKEARSIIKTGKIEVNGKVVRDEKYAVGFGDVILLKPTGESYKIGVSSKANIMIEKLEGKAKERVSKVIGKYLASGSKVMVRLLDGSVMSAGKEVMVNDSVIIDAGKIKKALKFEKGARCIVMKGTHASQEGTVKEIGKGSAQRSSIVSIEGKDGTFETLIENIMIVGA